MQTFLPFESFTETASILDRQRLGKQRVETYQILRTLTGVSNGWQQHPAVKMWRGYDVALADYGAAICLEWISRGYNDSLLPHFIDHLTKDDYELYDLPYWLGDKAFHDSHKSNLVRKLPEHYRSHFPDIQDDLPYIWPPAVQ